MSEGNLAQINKVYVVICEINEIDDFTSWNIAAYFNRMEAEEHAFSANKWLQNDNNKDTSKNPYDLVTTKDGKCYPKYAIFYIVIDVEVFATSWQYYNQ